MSDHTPSTRRSTLPRRLRLSGKGEFLPIYKSAVRVSVGPLLFYGVPNDRPHPRLGLAVSRRVGTAVKRNRLKRLVREAFRLSQYDWQAGYDVVISARPHTPLTLAEYQNALHTAMGTIHTKWQKKADKSSHSKPPRSDLDR